jgi:hypothetical protein
MATFLTRRPVVGDEQDVVLAAEAGDGLEILIPTWQRRLLDPRSFSRPVADVRLCHREAIVGGVVVEARSMSLPWSICDRYGAEVASRLLPGNGNG